jgi:hypothetical protein
MPQPTSRNSAVLRKCNPLILLQRLEHAASFGGTSAATTDVMAQQAFGHLEGALVRTIDYRGEGTAENPFQFAAHLQFHQASYALLRQMGVDVNECSRARVHDAAGCLCDRWEGPDRDYWFKVPTPT